MKQRLRLSESEALHLGFKPKQSKSGNPKYILNKKQVKELLKYRRNWNDLIDGINEFEEGKFEKLFKESRLLKSNVLVIGDLHEPFTLDGYLEFCIEQYKKWNCNKVVFIGDVVDNHFSSYHETSADGLGGSDELDLAITKIAKWYKAFPDAYVTLGNHDIIIMRKAQTGAIPTRWIKEYKDVLEVPKWKFVDEVIIDDVLYHHGIGSKAHIKAVKNMISTVGGHHHTEAYTHWFVGKKEKIFGMQVGCGINIKSYAMSYGKWFPKPAISCGVILEGKTPINIMMDL